MKTTHDQLAAPNSAPPVSREVATPNDHTEVEVAHEALIRHWDRLQGWLGEDRVGLQLREEVSDAAAAWAENGLNHEYLVHQGVRLREVTALQRVGRLQLNDLEARYVAANAELEARKDGEKRLQQARELQSARNVASANDRARREAEKRLAAEHRAGRLYRWLSLALAALVLFTSGLTWYARDQQDIAREQKEFAEQQASVAQTLGLTASSNNLATGGEQDELAALLGVEAARVGAETGLAGEVGTALQASIGAPYFSQLIDTGDQSSIASAAFDPNGERMVVGKFNGSIVLIDSLVNPPVIQYLAPVFGGGDNWITSVAFSPDGRYVAAAAYHGAIQIWDLAGVEPELVSSQLKLPRAVYSVTFGSSPNEGLFLLASSCATSNCANDLLGDDANVDESGSVGTVVVKRWLAGSGFSDASLPEFELPGNRIFATDISADGRWLAAGGCKRFPRPPTTTEPHRGNRCEAGFLYVQDLQRIDSSPISLDSGDGAIMAVAFAPESSDDIPRLAAGGEDRLIRIWQPNDRPDESVLKATLAGHNEEIRSLSFSSNPTSDLLVSSGYDGNVSLWNLDAAHPVLESLGGSSEWVRAVSFERRGNRMLSAAASGRIRLWEIIPDQPLSEPGILRGHASYIRAIAFGPNPDEPMLVSAAEGGTIRIWRVENGEATVREVKIRSRADGVKLSSIAFSANGSILVIADDAGAIWKLDPRDPSSEPVQIGTHSVGPLHVAFNPNHTIVAAGGKSGFVQLWDANGTQQLRIGKRHDTGGTQVWAIAFSRDGTLLAAGTASGAIYRWRIQDDGRSLEALPLLTTSTAAIRSLAFGADNELVTGSSDGVICFWGSGEPKPDAKGTSCPVPIQGHSSDVRTLSFNTTGDLLASGGIDQSVRLWNPHDPDASPVVIPTIMEWVRALAFSPDGRVLAASSTQGTIRIILPNTRDLMERTCAHVGRNMTEDEWSAYMQDAPYQPTCPDIGSNGEQGMTQQAPMSRESAQASQEDTRRPSRRKRT